MIDGYRRRAAHHVSLGDAERRRSTRISHWRLATFLAGTAGAAIAYRLAEPAPWIVPAVLFAGFTGLVFWQARVEARVAWHDALRLVNDRAVARIERRWDDLPPADPPPDVNLDRHPYAIDLDLFGRASLLQLLGPAATPIGHSTLMTWLLRAAGRDEILERQQAVVELTEPVEWRLEFAALGELARGAGRAEVDRLIAWAEGPAFPRLTLLKAAVLLLLLVFWPLLVLFAAGAMEAGLFGIPLLLGIVLSFALNERIQTAFDRAGAGGRSLERYAALFEQAAARPFTSPRLRAVHARLTATHASAPPSMRRLDRILGFATLRSGAPILHAVIQSMTLWDFWVLFALERWRRAAGAHVRDWLDALAEIDALGVLAGLRHDNPEWALPDISDEPLYTAEALVHPLLPATHRVANDVTVGPPGTILVVTGSNMSGKSTLLRALGLGAVLAHAGSCVCAARLRMPLVNLQTSIRVQDSLELGLSYFMAALARLKGVVDAAERRGDDRVLLYLLDEILQGTNSAERSIAVRAVARHLLDAGAIGAMTSHDLSLAGQEPLRSHARLVHFTEIVDAAGAMAFDYRLRPGLATSRNALRLMQMIGIEVSEKSESSE